MMNNDARGTWGKEGPLNAAAILVGNLTQKQKQKERQGSMLADKAGFAKRLTIKYR